MARYRSSRILPVILILVIVVIAVTALVSLTRAIFFSGQSTQQVVSDTSREALLNTTADHSVRMTVRGPIVANEEFRSYQITITPSSRSLVTYKGYTESAIDQITLSNNVRSYEQFVYALDKANLAKGVQLDDDQNDLRGICAIGEVYSFEIINAETIVKELWTSTCSGSKGSLSASAKQLMELFQNQIPGGEELIDDVNLS
jgi:hypothetical protein